MKFNVKLKHIEITLYNYKMFKRIFVLKDCILIRHVRTRKLRLELSFVYIFILQTNAHLVLTTN